MEKPAFSPSGAYSRQNAPYRPTRRRRTGGIVGWISGLFRFLLATSLFFLLMVLAIYWLFTIILGGGEIKTPNLVGKTMIEAAKELHESNLSIKWVRDQPSETIPEGCIISQDQTPGRSIKKGSSISVILSGGIALVQLPDLRNIPQNRAMLQLKKAGLDVGNRTLLPAPNLPIGTVLETDPPAGTGVPQNTLVNLLVATGQTPINQAMPNLVGMKLDQARDLLTQAGLFATEIKVSASAGTMPGRIAEQKPASGSPVTDSTRIVIKYVPGTEETAGEPPAIGEPNNQATSLTTTEFPSSDNPAPTANPPAAAPDDGSQPSVRVPEGAPEATPSVPEQNTN